MVNYNVTNCSSRQVHIRLLPYANVDLAYLLVPLMDGEHRIPLMRVNQDESSNNRPYDPQLPDKVIKYQQRMQISSLFIQVIFSNGYTFLHIVTTLLLKLIQLD